MAVYSSERCYTDFLQEQDLPSAAALFTSEQVRKYLGGAMTNDTAIKLLKKWSSDISRKYFAIRLISNDSFIGIIHITPHHDGVYTEVSYQLFPQFWGYGYACEIIKTTLEYCKYSLMLPCVVSETQTKNEKSRRLLEKVGYGLMTKVMRFNEEQCIYIYEF